MQCGSRPGNNSKKDVIVIGAGVVGVTTAFYLAKAGWNVSVLEKAADSGLGTSRANGGLVSLGLGHPWNAPSTPLTTLRWLGREDSPFLFRAKAFPSVIGWGLRFLVNCRPSAYRRSSEASVRLLAHSQRKLQETIAETAIAYDGLRKGILKVVGTPQALDIDEAEARSLEPLGLVCERLDAAACVDLEPALRSLAPQIAGALFFPEDESGDAWKFTQELASVCRRIGVDFQFGTSVTRLLGSGQKIAGLETNRGKFHADHYVLAAGGASRALAHSLGLRLPIYPVKGYSVTLPSEGIRQMPQRPFIDWDRKICVTPLGNRLRAAGTAEFAGEDEELTSARWRKLHEKMLEIFPELRPVREIEPWTGLRPMTPDHLPILGASPYENLTLNVGHGAQGWGLSCGSAAIVADVVGKRNSEIDLVPYALSRFGQ